MNNLHFNDLFNEDTLSIFTDASVYRDNKGYTISCPGAICVITKNNQCFILEQDFHERNIISGSTNNEGEISAVALGVYYAIKYSSQFKTINLYSDSNICVQGLNEWIFNWVKCMNKGLMYSSSGSPVANQSIISSIVNTIIEQKLNMNIFHQKGHVNINNSKSIEKAFMDFTNTNKIDKNIDEDIIKCISFYNDIVDVETKKTLQEYTKKYNNWEDTNKPIQFYPQVNPMNEYKNLIMKNI